MAHSLLPPEMEIGSALARRAPNPMVTTTRVRTVNTTSATRRRVHLPDACRSVMLSSSGANPGARHTTLRGAPEACGQRARGLDD